jgi:hypothetical protein
MTDKIKRTAPPPPVQSQPEVRYIRSPEYRSTYANNVAYVVSSLDFSLVFGQVLEGNKERITIEQNARVTMTPLQAKLLADLLSQQIEAFEKIHGTITIPAGMSVVPQAVAPPE